MKRAVVIFLLASCFVTAQVSAQSAALAASAGSSPTKQAFRISGTVVDESSGSPLAHARVTNTLNWDNRGIRQVITDNAGRFVFDNVPPAKYVLRAERAGYVTRAFNEHEGFSTAIAVGPGLKSEGLTFRLPPQSVIGGTVVDVRGDPVIQARVTVFQRRIAAGKTTFVSVADLVTDDQGEYEASGLSAGTYFMRVFGMPWYDVQPGYMAGYRQGRPGAIRTEPAEMRDSFPVTFYPNTTDVAEAQPIALKAGEHFRADFTLNVVPTFRVIVHSRGNVQNIGASLRRKTFGDELEGVPVRNTRYEAGTLELNGIPPGKYELVVNRFEKNEAHTSRLPLQVVGDTEISEGDESPMAAITGTFQCEGTNENDSCSASLVRSAFERFYIPVGRDGKIMNQGFIIPTGSYELQPQPQWVVTSIVATGARVSGDRIEISEAGPVRLEVRMTKSAGEIKGTALRADEPASGTMILLVPRDFAGDQARVRRDQSDSDGTFILNGIAPGRYVLMSIENGWDLEWSDPAILKKLEERGREVEIVPNARLNLKVTTQSAP